MSMSKQDFTTIAAILSEARTWARGRANTGPTIDYITRELADLMASGNTRFDRQRFYGAAGMLTREQS